MTIRYFLTNTARLADIGSICVLLLASLSIVRRRRGPATVVKRSWLAAVDPVDSGTPDRARRARLPGERGISARRQSYTRRPFLDTRGNPSVLTP